MSKEVRWSIILRDNIRGVLDKGAAAFRGFGRVVSGIAGGIGNVFKRVFSLPSLLMGGGAIAALSKVARAYSEQQAADSRLANAFGATGEEAEKLIKKWGDFATGIQRVTTLGDEEIMMLIALAKNMGVADSQLEEVTKGAIGLSKAFGMDLDSALKGVALAMQGEFTMLQRYIPALRSANTDTEKMAILQKAMASGFNQAKGELGTINGMWASFKGVVGDALQSVGKGLFGGGGLVDGLRRMKERLIEITESGIIEAWAKKSADAVRVLGGVLGDVLEGGEKRKQAFADMGKLVTAMFTDAGHAFLNVIGPGIDKAFRSAAGALWETLPDWMRGEDPRNHEYVEMVDGVETYRGSAPPPRSVNALQGALADIGGRRNAITVESMNEEARRSIAAHQAEIQGRMSHRSATPISAGEPTLMQRVKGGGQSVGLGEIFTQMDDKRKGIMPAGKGELGTRGNPMVIISPQLEPEAR
jgi:hypothetical protein